MYTYGYLFYIPINIIYVIIFGIKGIRENRKKEYYFFVIIWKNIREIIYFHGYGCSVFMRGCAPHVYSVCGSQKRALDILELELYMVVGDSMGPVNRT